MTGAPAMDERSRELLREAAEWRLLGLLLECPRPGWDTEIRDLAASIGDETLREAAGAAIEEASEGLYHSVFGVGGPAPPREASHQSSIQLGYVLAEIETYYREFAYTPSNGEVADHVAVEAGFVSYLRLKEAYARACGDQEKAEVAASAARGFISAHLSVMSAQLAASLEAGSEKYLALAGRALLARAPAAPRPAVPAVPDDPADEGSGFGCGPDRSPEFP
jgi:nitrate reductase assembly molybdenum cofactor insertion protein NarJ